MNITLEHLTKALNKAEANLSEITSEKERDEMEWDPEDDELITIAAGAVKALELIVETVEEDIADDKEFKYPLYTRAATGKSSTKSKKIPNDEDDVDVSENVNDGSMAWPLRDRSEKDEPAVTDEFLDGIMNRPKT